MIDELSLSSNNFVNYNDIQESVNSLILYYKEKNYHNVNVSYSIDDLFLFCSVIRQKLKVQNSEY